MNAVLVNLVERRIKRRGKGDPRCADCAFRTGSPANLSVLVEADVETAALAGEGFYCHHGPEGREPLCGGYRLLMEREDCRECGE